MPGVSRAGAPGASRTASRTTRIDEVGRVALAGEHPGEPAGLHHGLEPGHRPHLLRDELAGAVLLVVRVDLVERGLRGLVVDALAAQLLGQGPAGQAAAGLLGAHQHPGVGGVVDQADLLHPVEHRGGDVVGAVLARSACSSWDRLRGAAVSWRSTIWRAQS